MTDSPPEEPFDKGSTIAASPDDTAEQPVPTPAPPDTRTGDIWAVLAVVLMPGVYWAFAALFWPQVTIRNPPIAYFEMESIVRLTSWAALIALLIRRSGEPAMHFGLGRPQWIWDPILSFALLGIVWQVASWVGRVFGNLTEYDRSWVSAIPLAPETGWEYALTIVSAMTIGLVEELVWRGYLLVRLEAVIGSTAWACLLSSVLFGLGHLYQGPCGVINATALGLTFAFAFVLTRRLWPVAAAHGFYDAIVMAAW